MRVTGAADPTVSVKDTLEGKASAEEAGTSGSCTDTASYGNQIGLATGYVKEIYHPNYVAKTYGDRCRYGCRSENVTYSV